MSQLQKSKDRFFLNPSSLNRAIKDICDVLRRSNCAGAMQYIPELTWILFLRILDEQETLEETAAKLAGTTFDWSIEHPYRWQDWAATDETPLFPVREIQQQSRRIRNFARSQQGSLLKFVNEELFPYLRSLKEDHDATPRQKIISEIISNIERTKVDADYNLLAALRKVHEISIGRIDPTHIFPLSQIYEGLLLRMGQKSNDGGQFFTPREVVRAMVRVVNPEPGETIYDPCCGTGGFLAEAYQQVKGSGGDVLNRGAEIYGREKENLVYPLALANLVLHGVNEPHIWHGNTLTDHEVYGGLFRNAPTTFDVILTNPPFGGKESKEAQARFPQRSSSTQLLFLQHVIDSLKPQGRCGIVVDEGVLFRTNDTAFVRTKQRLLDTCNLWCIISLPIGVFANAGASVKTNVLFFTKGQPTQRIWYYDLSDIKVNKSNPLTSEHFVDFSRLVQHPEESERSWFVNRSQVESARYDLKAVNPHSTGHKESRSLKELLRKLEERNEEIQSNLRALSL